MATPTLRDARVDDVPLIHALIRELAVYEKLEQFYTATEADFRKSLFGEHPAAEVLLAFDGDACAGYAVTFQKYDTFLGKPGMYLEDLFVRPAYRGQGIGKALLAEVARRAVARDAGRLDWAVLDWNESAVGFYRKIGAESMDGWTVFRLTGEPLQRLADGQ